MDPALGISVGDPEPSAPAPRSISRDELRAKIDRGEPFRLVETLPAEHFEVSHLPGAISMPPEEVGTLAAVLLPDKQQEVVLYCASVKCHASENAANALAALGYVNVRYYTRRQTGLGDGGAPNRAWRSGVAPLTAEFRSSHAEPSQGKMARGIADRPSQRNLLDNSHHTGSRIGIQ